MAIPEGFAQPFPDLFSADLNRALVVTEVAALLALRESLQMAARQGSPVAFDVAIEDLRLPPVRRDAVARIGLALERSHRLRFYRAVGRRTRLSVASGPGSMLTVPGRAGVAVAPVNIEPALAVDRFVADVLGRAEAVSQGISPGVREALIRDVLAAQGDPERLTRDLLQAWEQEGVPTLLQTGRTTRTGAPVLSSARAHAAFIARDAIGTLQLEITRSLQTAVGIESFVWRTRGDSRVRPEHASRNGRTFSWADGTDGEFPGGPPACRCSAVAVVPLPDVLRAHLLGA